MFEFLRKLIFPIIIVVLFFFVAMIILQWGADITSSRRTDDTIGVIDGADIKYDEFDQYYRNLLRQEQENTDYDIPDQKMAELRDNAWLTGTVNNELIFKTDIAVRWEHALRLIGVDPALLSGTAGHA